MEPRIDKAEINQGLLDGLLKTEMYLSKSGLDHKLLELLKYRVSQLNGCAYCLDMHHKVAISLGETELRLHTLVAWRECPYYTEEERAALDYAEALTQLHHHGVTDTIFSTLSQFFNKSQIADLTIAIANINSWNRLNIAFRSTPGNYVLGQSFK